MPDDLILWPMPSFISEPLEELASEIESDLWTIKVQQERQAYLTE